MQQQGMFEPRKNLLSRCNFPGRAGELELTWLGRLSFAAARLQQEQLAAKRGDGVIGDTLLLCEHPPTLSLGKRTQAEDLPADTPRLRAAGMELVEADRGGGPTYHGPGQLVLYPVISLRERRLGVKRFVEQMLEVLASACAAAGVAADVKLDPAGVWVENRKLASAGLRIKDGITLHGFSLNLNCPLTVFSTFNPCGIAGCPVSSLEAEGAEEGALTTFGTTLARFVAELGER